MVYDMLLMYHTITAFPYLVRSAHPPPLSSCAILILRKQMMERLAHGAVTHYIVTLSLSLSLSIIHLPLSVSLSFFSSVVLLLLYLSLSNCVQVFFFKLFIYRSLFLLFIYCYLCLLFCQLFISYSLFLSISLSLCLYFFHSFICCRSLLFPFFASYLVKELPSTRSVLYLSRLSCLLLNTREQSPLGEGSLYGWSLI